MGVELRGRGRGAFVGRSAEGVRPEKPSSMSSHVSGTHNLRYAKQSPSHLRQLHWGSPHFPLSLVGHALAAHGAREDLMSKAYSCNISRRR